MNKNYVVTRSNHFIMNSSYDLSLEEQKLILTLASMVQPEDEEFKPYVFKISEFMKLLGVENQAKYTEIPKMTKELMKKVFEIEEGDKLIQTAWLSGTVYQKGTGYVVLRFNPDLKPYMLKLNSMFTQYKLGNILSMKSKYSPRIYEIMKCNEFKKQKFIEIEVSELRKLLKATKIYPKYNDFKRKIILQSQKELKKISDISFEFDEIKTGRKVTALRFYIHSKNQKEMALNINNILPQGTVEEDDLVEESEVVEAEVVEDIDNELINTIETIVQIIQNICDRKITYNVALRIYESATVHNDYKNNEIELITEVAKYSLTQDIKDNFEGWLINTVKRFEKPQRKNKKLKFNNFKGRNYDYDKLEDKLLAHYQDDDEEYSNYEDQDDNYIPEEYRKYN